MSCLAGQQPVMGNIFKQIHNFLKLSGWMFLPLVFKRAREDSRKVDTPSRARNLAPHPTAQAPLPAVSTLWLFSSSLPLYVTIWILVVFTTSFSVTIVFPEPHVTRIILQTLPAPSLQSLSLKDCFHRVTST